MAVKFSGFTNQAVDTELTHIVGYKSNTNTRYTIAQLSAGVVSAYDKYEFTTNIFLSNAKTIGRDNGTIRNANLQFVDVAPSGNIGFSFRDGGSDKVFIDGSGKIGVGTTDPTASIDTDGSIFLSTNAKTIGRDNGTIRNANIQFADVSALGNHALSFRDGGSDLMVVDGGGNVGIGVTDPDEKLEIAGNVHVQGQGYSELHDDEITNLTFNWNDGNIQTTTMGASSPTFTPTNPKLGATYILTLVQTDTVTATWTGVKWPAATAPTLSGAGKTDIITLICYNEADTGLYYGSSVLNFTT